MDLEMLYSSLAIILAIILVVKTLNNLNNNKPNKNKSKKIPPPPPPPSPPSLPIVGHLHLLKDPHHTCFHSLAQLYGPIFSLQLGRQPILVVSQPHLVEECFTKNDILFANRPESLIGQHFGYNHTVLVWTPYGPQWRNLRRVTNLTALSQKQIQLGGPARRAEISSMTMKLVSCGPHVVVNLNELFGEVSRNLVMRVVNGKQWEYFKMEPSDNLMTIFEYFPALRWVGFKGIEKMIGNIQKERDGVFQMLIDEAKEKLRLRKMSGESFENDKKMFVDELVELQVNEPDYYTDDILKGLIAVLLVGGTDTNARTLRWAMTVLLNNQNIFEKARNEMDTHVPRGRMVEDSDIPKLDYIRYIIYETLRLFPPAPLLLPHLSSSDSTIGGYHVPKGTTLLVNVWSIQRDPNLWEHPLEFRPERFEHECEGSKYFPFGLGRRACPGNNFALKSVALVLATLVQCFDWDIEENGAIDLAKEIANGTLTMLDDKPLLARCRPCFSMDVLSS